MVDIVSYCCYWHLHREVDGRHFFGHSDHRIGLSIRELKGEELKQVNWKTREPKILQEYKDKDGKIETYEDEPYTETQISSFAKLTLEELEKWVSKGY